jgi:VWFA-related protein
MMILIHSSLRKSLQAALLCLSFFVPAAIVAQEQKPQPPERTDDVLRINTALVQTDAMVFDEQGRFVDGLKPEQFELRVDGKPQKISFFEIVRAGSLNEEAQIAAARGAPLSVKGQPAPKPLDRGRLIFFFVDDLHISSSNMTGVRALLTRFVEKEMRQNDEVAIASVSGQIGFLQQLTSEKAVLRLAIERLKPRSSPTGDGAGTPMSEYQALLVSRFDQAVTDFFVDRTISENPGLRRNRAVDMVRSRAQMILQQSSSINKNTLGALESLVAESASLSGRKLLFFISDGFFLDQQTADGVRRVTGVAARAGAVLYSIDSRGLVATLNDSNSDVVVDPSNRLERSSSEEMRAALDPLHTLAVETGGRPIFNTNAPTSEMTKALEETSVYYLVVWRPESEEQRSGRFRRVELKVLGRPELIVRVRRGYLEAEQAARRNSTDSRRAQLKGVDDQLREAISSLYPINGLPTHLDLVYMDAPDNGPNLIVSMQIAKESITFNHAGDKRTGAVDLGGAIFDADGKPAATFKERLDINANSLTSPERQQRHIIYHFQTHLAPGIYQVRAAGRDAQSGLTGSAMKWIEIPDLAARRLSLSSLLLSETSQGAEAGKQDSASSAKPLLSVDHRFARSSKIRFLTFIYNAARGGNGAMVSPDVALQLQVLRDDQPVVTTPLGKVETKEIADLTRIPYAAEISLEGLPAGRYVLQVSVIDRVAKASAAQRTSFEIE